MTEQPVAYLRDLACVIIVRELAGCHVIDEQMRPGPQGGDRGVESLPLPALGISEDQVETADASGDLHRVADQKCDPGRPGVLRGQRRGGGVDLDGDDLHVIAALQAVRDPGRAGARSGAKLKHASLRRNRRGQDSEQPAGAGIARHGESGVLRPFSGHADRFWQHARSLFSLRNL
jgi:hypothetical protein